MAFISTESLEVLEPLPGWKGKFLHSDNMSFMHYTVAADAEPIPDHQHPNEEVWNIIEGSFEVVIDGDRRMVGPGDVAIVPSNAEHSLKSMGEGGRAIVVNYPHRLKQ